MAGKAGSRKSPAGCIGRTAFRQNQAGMDKRQCTDRTGWNAILVHDSYKPETIRD